MGWHFGKKTWRHHHTNFNGYPRGYLIQHGATSLSLSTNYQIFYITVHTMQVAMLSYLSYLTCHPRYHATHLKKWVWPVFQIFLRPLTKPLLPYNADWNEPWLGPICLDMSSIIPCGPHWEKLHGGRLSRFSMANDSMIDQATVMVTGERIQGPWYVLSLSDLLRTSWGRSRFSQITRQLKQIG